MRVVLIFDQGLAGAGGKGNPNVGLTLAKGGVGSALMLEPHLQKVGAQVLATLYCGNKYFVEHETEVVQKLTAMVKKINPDVVVCGPCFNFADYAKMSALVTESVQTNSEIPVVTMMAAENADLITEFKDKIAIIKMPKKGGVGLSDSFDNLTTWLDYKLNHPDKLAQLEQDICY